MRVQIQRATCLAALASLIVLVSAGAAKSDTIYNVSGTFATSATLTGPLNGGSFTGTFTATLPITSGIESITTFNISLINSSGTVLANLTNVDDTGQVGVSASNCATSSSTIGPCDVFAFYNGPNTDALQLTTSLGFTGGAVTPGFDINATFTSFGYIGGQSATTDSLVVSGSINPVTTSPEPACLLLLGTGLLGLAILVRHRERQAAPSNNIG